MKRILITILLTSFVARLFGQTNFSVEDRKIKTGTVERTYTFHYQLQDSIHIFFADSTVEFSNPSKTIVKQISYADFDKEPSTKIEYFRTNGGDSVCKYFSGNELTSIYTTGFDSIGRIISHAMTDFKDSTRSFESTYTYRDSSISTGRILIQTVFNHDAFAGKRFGFQTLYEYDNKNRIIKETREDRTNDPMAQIIHYKYNGQDSLIEKRIDGIIGNMRSTNEPINTPCYRTIVKAFYVTRFSDYKPIIRQLLSENETILNANKCENFIGIYISPDKKMKIILRKVKPYWEGGRKVKVIVTKTYS